MGSSICGDIDARPHHVVLFPFMSKGHIIPILHLTRLLLHRRLAVTIFTTQANHAFITESLNDTQPPFLTSPSLTTCLISLLESRALKNCLQYPYSIHSLTLQRSCNLTSNERSRLFHMSDSWYLMRSFGGLQSLPPSSTSHDWCSMV